MTTHINFCSGGIGSYICGKRVAAKHGTENLIHLFNDTKSEDEDLYRFLRESVALTGGELVCIADGRDLWELFNDHGFIANTRVDVCSRTLKRELASNWIKERYAEPSIRIVEDGDDIYTEEEHNAILYFGIDNSEYSRVAAILHNWKPYQVYFPLCSPPFMTKCDMLKECERDGLDPPRMYDEGFPHNNCNGFCVKGGQAHFLHLLNNRPAVFMENAGKERAFRTRTGKDVAVLRDRRGGVTKPLTMLEFKRQVESGELVVNPRDWGKGCQCFSGPEE